jgi:hypothetical protein
MSYIIKAINNLKPGAEFVVFENDYSTIEWHSIDGAAPTKAQVEAEIKSIKLAEENAITVNAAAKAALLEKLGITEDEAKLLLS